MGTNLDKRAFEKLIEEDIKYLNEIAEESSLERQHIVDILEQSVDCYYPDSDKDFNLFWFTNFNRPRYSKEDESFSETVLMNDGEGFHTVGWFDFKRNEWQYDGDFAMPSRFFWRYFPKLRKPPLSTKL